jgi:single-stranded-DNA-specific exonuclease
MLTSASESRAREIADYLEGQNRERQAVERKIVEQAIAQVTENKLDGDDSRAIVLGHESWHAGVVGIVASRLVDKFHRPAVLVALSNGHGQGSGRSVAGFNLAKALEACGEHLQSFGGHEMAAGLKIESSRFEAFRDAFADYARRTISEDLLTPRLSIDAVAELAEITPALVSDLARLAPFGNGNPRPILCCRNLRTAFPARRVGKTGDHLQLTVRQGAAQMKCIAFGHGALESSLTTGTPIDLAVEPILNEFNGRTQVELEVKDIQFARLGG